MRIGGRTAGGGARRAAAAERRPERVLPAAGVGAEAGVAKISPCRPEVEK